VKDVREEKGNTVRTDGREKAAFAEEIWTAE